MKRLSAVLAAALAVCAVAVAGCGGPSQSATGSVHPNGWGGTPKGVVLPAPLPTAVPTAEMLDGIYVSDFHGLQPFALAGYTAGAWPDYLGLRAAFPTTHAISIAISARWHADCLDIEPGDAVPSQAGPWAKADIAAGFKHPCEYGDLSEMPAIKASLAATFGPNWHAVNFLWLAWYRFVPGLVSGYDAVQWTDRALGRNLDESTVSLPFLTIAQPPYVAPTPKPAPQPPPVCFHKREAAATCAAVKAKVASDLRAAASSRRALHATNAALARNRCAKPYRRGVCIHKGRDARVFRQRIRWFTAAARKLEAAN